MEPLKATIAGTQEMMKPVFAAISTTIVAFSPLLFMSGIMGKFIWVMPAVVITALVASLIESFFILPSHIYEMTKFQSKPKRFRNLLKSSKVPKAEVSTELKMEGNLQIKIINSLERVYYPVIKQCLQHRYIALVVVVVILFLGILLMRPLGFILFPKGGD